MKQLKANQIKRLWRAAEHEENLKNLPDLTHRITGWDQLVQYTGVNREKLNRLIKMHGFPKPRFIYRQKADQTRHQAITWRRTAVWDKREIGDWDKGSSKECGL